MKHAFTNGVLMMLLATASLFAQQNVLQYFPLDTSNVWQYRVTLLNPEPPDSTYYMTVRIAGDTLLPNGKHYKILDKLPLARYARSFVRIDSAVLVVRAYQPFSACGDSEVVLFRLLLDSLSYHGCHGTFITSDTGRSQIGLMQRNARFQGYRWFDGFSNNYILHDSVGISFFRQWELAGWQGTLVAARINGVQYGIFVGVSLEQAETPNGFALKQNYPNPFNPTTRIEYAIPRTSHVSLKVFDLVGREVATLVDEVQGAGFKSVEFDASGLASGVYFYRLIAGSFVQTRKLMMIR